MAEKKKMSVEEILAAARKKDSGAGGGGASAAPPAESTPAASTEPAPAATPSAPAASSPASTASSAGKPAAKVKPGSMSVAEMLAAARGQKSAPAPAAAPVAKAEPKPAAPKPAAKPAAEKVAAKPAAAKAPTIDTTSILAAARSAAKPGPVSKAEAAAKGLAPAETGGKKKLEVPPMPAKPSFAKPAAAKAETTRRGFFDYLTSVVLGSSLAFGFASLAVTQLMWVLGLARYMFPNILTEPPSRFKVGFPDVLGSGQVDERFKAQFGVWIVKAEYEGQLQVFALKTVCTHLGCTPNWLEGEQKFKCPCHGSGFYKDGINFEGPAPRPLERYAIKIADDGQLEVDKSRVFHEELGQWKDSASFVPA